MKKALIKLITVYQNTLSPDTGVFRTHSRSVCAFEPTCSEYTKRAVEKHGAGKGILLAMRRILRCHPWQKNHYDPVK